MMSTTVQKPATTPIPVQLSAPEFEAFIFPHLSMPKRGPKCKLGYAWEDKFKRLLLRFERIQQRHYGMKLMAYTLINLRKFCGT